ncbi:MAG: hypothetical protein JW822_12025 [Spirochaetales bacterium]|nr:hypothetical protein [Spirochaetales bacterium]
MESFLFIIACQLISFLLLYIILKRKLDKQYSKQGQIETIESEVEKIIIELNQTTSRNIGLIEDKMKEIESLLDSTEKRLNTLKRESEKHDLSKKVYNNLIANDHKSQNRNIKDEVIRLYSSGFPSEMIANQLGASVGEVELIISLSENK